MGFIYRILNKINGKSYIGKTEVSVGWRIKQHIRDSKRDSNKERPLYRAIRKYGIDNFLVQTLEEIQDSLLLSEAEIGWIHHFNTFKSGYNATCGGEGKSFVDSLKILELHADGISTTEICTETGYDRFTVLKYLRMNGKTPINLGRGTKAVRCIDTGECFESQHHAARFLLQDSFPDSLVSSVANKISLCCRGKRKSAYKLRWEYLSY